MSMWQNPAEEAARMSGFSMGYGESNKQIFLSAVPLLQPSRFGQGHAFPKSDGLTILYSFFLIGIIVTAGFPSVSPLFLFFLQAVTYPLFFITIYAETGLTAV